MVALDWIDLNEDGGFYECGNEPSGSIKCGVFLTNGGRFIFLGRTLLTGVL